MKIAVLNAGSSSQKSCLYDISNLLPRDPLKPVWSGHIEWRNETTGLMSVKTAAGASVKTETEVTSRAEGVAALLNTLWQGDTRVISGPEAIDVVGHRVVHGGEEYRQPVLITKDVKDTISRLSLLAPAHNPANLEGIEVMEGLLGDVPQVAVFDTAFHSQIPTVASTYAGPYKWVEQGIRKYGFHGISHEYCSGRVAHLMGRSLEELQMIVCHLGNGCSLSAIANGHSIDTTMGFTPLDGLMMGTRSGSVDPGILIHLLRQGRSPDELDRMLNKLSGLKGISGISNDLREIDAAIADGNSRAQLALDMFLYRLKSAIGSMLMNLGGVDVIAFTAGIGEHSASIRAAVAESLGFLGAELDVEQNQGGSGDRCISTDSSAIQLFVVETQEDWAIAQSCWQLMK